MAAGSGPREIWKYYLQTLDIFGWFANLARDSQLAARADAPSWTGVTAKELDVRMEELTKELELEVSLALVAGFEGILRADFDGRKAVGAAHPLFSRTKWPGFHAAIKIWRRGQASDVTGQVEEFFAVIRFRDKLAHGRRDLERGGVEFDPGQIRRAAYALQSAIRAFPILVEHGDATDRLHE